MRRDRSMKRRVVARAVVVVLTAVLLTALVLGGVGAIRLLQGFTLRATYRAEPGKLTVGIKAELEPSYQGIELPPPPTYISEDDVPPPLEIPAAGDSGNARTEQVQAVGKSDVVDHP